MRQRPMLRVVPRWRERPPLGKDATIGQFDILDPSTWFDSSGNAVGTQDTSGGDNSLLSGGGGVSGTSTLTDTGSGQTIDSNGNISGGGGTVDTSGGGGGTVSPGGGGGTPGAIVAPQAAMDWTPWIWGGVAVVAVGGIALIAMKGKRKANPSRRRRKRKK